MESTTSKRQNLKCKALIAAGIPLDSTMNIMEESSIRKTYREFLLDVAETSDLSFHTLECLAVIFSKIQKWSKPNKIGIQKQQFLDILHCVFDITESRLMDRIFDALMKKPSLYMPMQTWIMSMDLILSGTLQEKINYCYHVYNKTGERILSKDPLYKLMEKSIFSQISVEDAEVDSRELVDVLTMKMDADRDGKISLNDFTKAIKKQPLLLEAFGPCLPYRAQVLAFLTTMSDEEFEI